MDEFNGKVSIEICKKDDEIVFSTLLPTSCFTDIDVAAILSYLLSRYDVLYFCASICDGGLDRSVTFRMKNCHSDVK